MMYVGKGLVDRRTGGSFVAPAGAVEHFVTEETTVESKLCTLFSTTCW